MENEQLKGDFRSGFIAIVGRPNVGKSTLLNRFVGEKVAIVSDRPQTTRNRIMGIKTKEDYQMVFLDTPGMHTARTKLGNYMLQSIKEAMDGMDVLVVMVDSGAVGNHDRTIVEDMGKKKIPKVLVLNKVDLLVKEKLLALMDEFSQMGYDAIIPISAATGDGVDQLEKSLLSFLPAGPMYFPEDMITDQPERMVCAELIREKAMKHLREEIPHGIGIEMLAMDKKNDDFMEIHATLYCEKESHKRIIIGKQGTMLKKIGQEARFDIERFLGMHINLQLWVKVREDWRNRKGDLRTLGYEL